MAVITISREHGSDGDLIAEQAAQVLGYHLVGKELIAMLLSEYGLVEFDKQYERLPSFWERFNAQREQRREQIVLMLNQIVPALAQHGMDAADYVPDMARWMTALSVAALVFGVLLSLLLARAWQAGLYNPGGFGAEFRALRLGKRFALAALLIAALAAVPQIGAAAAVAADTLFTLLLVYLLQGLALAHALVRRLQAQRGWLIGLYVLLLVAAPQVMPLLALLGWVDAWVDVRNRVPGRDGSGSDN